MKKDTATGMRTCSNAPQNIELSSGRLRRVAVSFPLFTLLFSLPSFAQRVVNIPSSHHPAYQSRLQLHLHFAHHILTAFGATFASTASA